MKINHLAPRRLRRLAFSLIMPLWLGGCYYGQAIKGHLSLMSKRESAQTIVDDDTRDPELRQRLRVALDARRFAADHLALPDNASYTHFVDLGDQPPVWIVVAAPALSLEPRVWCYPFAGCVTYRGYFKASAAQQHAQKLARNEGLDTAVTAGAAYSTLGWFADPLLSNMLRYPDPELAGLIFHELAHQLVYVKGDSRFNESFATAVERIGVDRWLDHTNQPDEARRWQERAAMRRQFDQLLRLTRTDLEAIYSGADEEEVKLSRKAERLAQLQIDYQQLKSSWDNNPRYDGFFERPPNNADFALLATYESAVPAFLQLYRDQDRSLEAFYTEVRELASASQETRDRWIEQHDDHSQ